MHMDCTLSNSKNVGRSRRDWDLYESSERRKVGNDKAAVCMWIWITSVPAHTRSFIFLSISQLYNNSEETSSSICLHAGVYASVGSEVAFLSESL